MSSRPHIPGFTTGKLIGRGAFASVFLVVNQKNGARYACKSFDKTSIADPTRATKMLKQEINALKTLSHPNIIKFHSIAETDSYFCVLMELCQGGSLDREIAKQSKFDESTSKIIFTQILNALQYCHSRDIAHRDLKPSNILIKKFPTIKLSDFGLSGIMGSENLMSTQCGTILFSALECFQGHNYNGVAADIWSSGVLLYTMLTGKIPWKGTSQIELFNEMKKGPSPIAGVSAECNNLIKLALAENPSSRPSAAELLKHPWFHSEIPIPLSMNDPSTKSHQALLPHSSSSTSKPPPLAAQPYERKTSSPIVQPPKKPTQSLNQSLPIPDSPANFNLMQPKKSENSALKLNFKH